jgi:hypothetical protein
MESFEELLAGLTEEQKTAFYRALNESGVTRDDKVLAKLMKTLLLYKGYYESIAGSVKKSVEQSAKIMAAIDELASQAAKSAEEADKSQKLLQQDTAQINETLSKLHTHVEEAAIKTAPVVSNQMSALLTDAMSKALPLSDMTTAGKSFNEAVTNGKQAAAELQAKIRLIRLAHIRNYALAAIALLAVSWVFFYFRYELRMEKERYTLAAQYGNNGNILMSLEKTNRKLELLTDKNNPKRRLIVVNNATGWTSNGSHGVIEIKD